MPKGMFRPPKSNRLVTGVMSALTPWLLRFPWMNIRVQLSSDIFERFCQLRDERLLLLPNHPSAQDPLVMYEVARQLGEPFNYVAAREIFDYLNGFMGWLIQRCGGYSVIRGKADRESFRTTRNILAKPGSRLMIFIEGEISHENDTLIPFEPGVIQLAFWSLEDMHRKQHATSQTLPPLYVAPVAIKYFYGPGAEQAVTHALDAMERAAGLKCASDNLYLRVRALGEKVLSVHESQLGISSSSNESMNTRADRVRHRILHQMESFFHLEENRDLPFLDRVRNIRNHMDSLIYTYQDHGELSPYELRMLEHLKTTFQAFYNDLKRLVNFMTFQEGRVIEGLDAQLDPEHFNAERYMELVHRLEKEVFGDVMTVHPRTAVIQLGELMNLSERFQEYQSDKKSTVKAIAFELESSMDRMLKNTRKATLSHYAVRMF